LAVTVCALTAFVGVRLVRNGGPGLGNLFGRTVVFLPSDELPSPEPDISGIFIRRENNSILIGTGNIRWEIYRENDLATPVFTKSYDGPEVELVINHATSSTVRAPAGRDTVQRPGAAAREQVSEAKIGEDQEQLLWAWGQREGDRFLAQTVLIFGRPDSSGC
jgi:hypothetical protein